MKPRLIILNQEQFGYNPATYYYCKYLRNRYSITYIGKDHGLETIDMSEVEIVNINNKNRLLRIVNLIKEVLKHTSSNKTIIFIKYFRVVCTFVRILRPNNPQIIDIRSSSIEPSMFRRFFEDMLLKTETTFFKNITVISYSLAQRLKLQSRCSILPLGAEALSKDNKTFDKLKLLYVGTLHNRNIHKSIEGFAKFYKTNKKAHNSTFTIIGAGLGTEVEQLKNLVKELKLQGAVHILGRVPHNQIQQYFDIHNIGVSYIPLTPYYDVQPPTKTFEYLLSGLAVIATETYENKLIIDQTNGILIGDSAEDFYRGLEEIKSQLQHFNSETIRNQSLKYEWQNITHSLDQYLQKIQ
jgi:glycosyltransferase involved in cell wall biosynthesis